MSTTAAHERRAQTSLVYCADEPRIALSSLHAARALAEQLNAPSAARKPWYVREIGHNDAWAVRAICDEAAVPVPPAVIGALLDTADEEIWMAITTRQARAALAWADRSPERGDVQLALRGACLTVTRGDAAATIDAAGDEVPKQTMTPLGPVVKFAIDTQALSDTVASAVAKDDTQITLCAPRGTR
jgi:hypothetical protein